MVHRLSRPGKATNNIQRRIFLAFVRSGGDPTDDVAVDELLRHLEGTLVTLPPTIARSLQVAWRSTGPASNNHLAELLSRWEGRTVSAAAARQRLSRGARMFEQAIRRRPWKRRRAAGPPVSGTNDGRRGGARRGRRSVTS